MENVGLREYRIVVEDLFRRFPSFQSDGARAYKPGIDNMLFFDQLLGHPHQKYQTMHIAGTNGKGSVSNMLASVLAAAGQKVGLYTSPHILDFRERMRIIDGRRQQTSRQPGVDPTPPGPVEYISEKEVLDFVTKWNSTFDHLSLSFFEITTAMAFDWFAIRGVDVAVIETGLGGRLDSTNIISPCLSVITNIGLDHCDMLGSTLPEIAFEKAGIIKARTPIVIGESDPEIDPVFERKVLYTNLSDPEYMGDRQRIMSLLTYADKARPSLWSDSPAILAEMDLQGEYQQKNLRTVLTAIDVLRNLSVSVPDNLNRCSKSPVSVPDNAKLRDAIVHTAARMDFHGRWERLSTDPYIIADIGHNAHGLKYNFAQLEHLVENQEDVEPGTQSGISGEGVNGKRKFKKLIIVYGSVSDKDISSIYPLMPQNAYYIFTQAHSKRAMPAEEILAQFLTTAAPGSKAEAAGTVAEAVAKAMSLAKAEGPDTLVYIGGSTYIVSEAIEALS